MSSGIRCMWMRGGTSKGGYFLSEDIPTNEDERNSLLLRVMGSPDPRQIDGMGGSDPLTSKVAIVKKSKRKGVDVDYLFLQVFVDQSIVTAAQNCGNILAGVGPFAIERGLVRAQDGVTPVKIYMENTSQLASALIATPNCRVNYSGNSKIDGVPGNAAAVAITFMNTAGSSCGALLPTGHICDKINGIDVTMIDNGMPCVIVRSEDLGVTGNEKPEELEANKNLRKIIEELRLKCGLLMNLGSVKEKTVPKITIVSKAQRGGTISTRTFIPHTCHKAIGVLGAVSVATACAMKGSTAYNLALQMDGNERHLSIEHPTGEMTVVATIDENGTVSEAAILRTARKLMDGEVFI